MQHHIAFGNDIHDATWLRQQGMHEGPRTWNNIVEHLPRKIHKVFIIMNSATGHHMIFLVQSQPSHQKIQQIGINLLVVHKTRGLSLLPVLQTLLQVINQIGVEITVQIQFRIAGNLDQMSHEFIKPEGCKQIGQIVAHNVLQQYQILGTLGRWQNHHSWQVTHWDFNQCISMHHRAL